MWSVFFVFLSYLDRNFVRGELLSQSLDADKESKELFYMLNNTLCAQSSVAGEHHLHRITDGVEEVRSLRDSGGRLVDCSVIHNQMQAKSFMHVCRLGLREQKAISGLKPSLTGLAEAKANCDKMKSKSSNVIAKSQPQKNPNPGAENQPKPRSKRGFTYPGTLWCGAGNIAEHYDQLGEFAETDNCCRVHDHCPHVIHAFSSNYGYTNFKWHSISHCDCDNAMKDCLRVVNDTSSRVVGQAFFNVIEVPCFEFSYEEQCVERHWYGTCKKYDRVPIAVIKESIPYDFGGIEVIDVLTLAPPKKKNPEEPQNKSEESTTQSVFSESKTSSPEEPSLTNVVTAAEDFIKVLATVSTSQSSSADTGKGETQTSERKKKKNPAKKKNKSAKKNGKGKGRKKLKKTTTALKVDEGHASAEEVMNKNYLVENTAKTNYLTKKENNLISSELDDVGHEPLNNKMLKDDPDRAMNNSQDDGSTSEHQAKEPEIIESRPAVPDMTIISPTAHAGSAGIKNGNHNPRQRPRQKHRKNKLIDVPHHQVHIESQTKSIHSIIHATESYSERPEVLQQTDKRFIVPSPDTVPHQTQRPGLRLTEQIKKERKPPSQTQAPLPEVTPPNLRPTAKTKTQRLEHLEDLKPTTPRRSKLIIKRKKSSPKDLPVIRICYEAVITSEADTTQMEMDSVFRSVHPELKRLFPALQTSVPSVVTLRHAKMKRRGRENRAKMEKMKRDSAK